jgi:cell division protein FtsI/penicillin-binding protein 2
MRPTTRRQPVIHNDGVSFQRKRFEMIYFLIVGVFLVIVVRLFYLQVIMYKEYKNRAFLGQYKEQQIQPRRGSIDAFDGVNRVPFVLNEDTFTLFADPKYVKDKDATAGKLSPIIRMSSKDIKDKISNSQTRYAVIAKKLNKQQKEDIEKLELLGVGVRTVPARSYPNGQLASQLLGFVDGEGNGKYGIEQYLNDDLKGDIGVLKAVTDANGVPLINNKDNILKDAKDGKRVLLTLDVGMQKRAEDTLKNFLPTVNSKSGSVVIMDPNTGAVKAMANYPTYNPSEYFKVEDQKLFQNAVVADPLEVGSIMKTLTVSAGINEAAIAPETTYKDAGIMKIDDKEVKNVVGYRTPQNRPITDVLNLSLNTGAVYILQQLGGGTLNEQGRIKWHDYLTNRFQFGKKTGIEQGYEAEGYVPDPVKGFGKNIEYANMAFGQGLSVTQLQMAAAVSSAINGGTYYRPHIVASTEDNKATVDNNVEKVKEQVITPESSKKVRDMMKFAVDKSYTLLRRDGYLVGGKTGTAEVAKAGGGYYDDSVVNGTFVGFLGIDKPEYVIMVRVNEPKIVGYAGYKAAAPLFAQIEDMIINNYLVSQAR